MENINVYINKSTRMVTLSKSTLGNDGENLQENLVFSFVDEFVNGTARLEITMPDDTSSYAMLTKVGETYQLPVQSVMTQEGKIAIQLVIVEGEDEEEIPIFKSNVSYLRVRKSINAEIEQDESYSQWIDVASEKLNELDSVIEEASNLNIEVSKSGTTTILTLTDKDGETSSVSILDGAKGDTGSAGSDGITPTIGNNGNWYLGETDTGKPSRGIQGETGQAGSDGADGISPTVTTSKSGTTTTITITDKNGNHTATINDGIDGTNGQDGRDGYVQYTAGDNITIENNVISALGGGVETQKIPATVYLDSINPGIYFFNKDISSVNIKKDANSYGWSYYKPFLLIIKENYNPEVLTGEPLAVVYYSGSTSSPALSFTEFYTDSQGNILRENTGAGDLLNSLNQSIFGEKTFFTIPKQGDTTAPTQNTQFTNKKYVDDLIGSISGGGDVVEKVTTSTSDPFVFEGKKKGLYYITNSSAKFHYKVTETSSVQSNNLRTIFLFLISDYGEITSGTFAHTIYINPAQGSGNGNLYIGNCTISNGSIVLNSQSTKLGQVVTTGDQQIDGIKTFVSLPLSSVVPTLDTQLANKKYVDDSISSAIGNINTILATLTTPSNGGE